MLVDEQSKIERQIEEGHIGVLNVVRDKGICKGLRDGQSDGHNVVSTLEMYRTTVCFSHVTDGMLRGEGLV